MENPQRPHDLKPGVVALLGIGFDGNASFLQGAARAPGVIREMMASGSSNLCAETGVDLAGHPRYRDLGDWEYGAGGVEEVFAGITRTIGEVVGQGAMPLVLGGDHSITYPIVRAVALRYRPLTILHFDAHPDLYEVYEGNRYSHACPFARIMEEGLASRLVQVGIRTMNPPQKKQADRFGVEVHEMCDWPEAMDLHFKDPVYVSLDLDVFDPGYAPGVSHHEPGGFSPREVIRMLHGLRGPMIGGDIVELNPSRDVIGVTAMLAAKMVKEMAGAMLRG